MPGFLVAVTTPPVYVVYEGDSITYALDHGVTIAQRYATLATAAITPNAVEGSPMDATGGANLTTLNARMPTAVGGGIKNILSVLIGVNDLAGNHNTTTFYTALKSYWARMRANGFKVLAITLLPGKDSAVYVGYNADRNAVNTLIKSDPSLYDVLADFGADATCGPDAAASNASLYPDGLHPSATCHAIFGPIEATAINSIP